MWDPCAASINVWLRIREAGRGAPSSDQVFCAIHVDVPQRCSQPRTGCGMVTDPGRRNADHGTPRYGLSLCSSMSYPKPRLHGQRFLRHPESKPARFSLLGTVRHAIVRRLLTASSAVTSSRRRSSGCRPRSTTCPETRTNRWSTSTGKASHSCHGTSPRRTRSELDYRRTSETS